MTVEHFVGGGVLPPGGMASQLVTGKGVPIKGRPEAGQDEMALKRKFTKAREAGEFLKFPGTNSIASITVRDGITTLSA